MQRWKVLQQPISSGDLVRETGIRVKMQETHGKTYQISEGPIRGWGGAAGRGVEYIDIGDSVRILMTDEAWICDQIAIELPPLPRTMGSVIKIGGRVAVLMMGKGGMIWRYATLPHTVVPNDNLAEAEVLFDAGA